MQRRTFLKKSAVGIGALAGFYGGVLKAEEVSGKQHFVETAQSNANHLVEGRGPGHVGNQRSYSQVALEHAPFHR